MKKITRYFFEGLLLAAPLGITFYVIFWIWKILDQVNPTSIPGLGLLIIIVFVTLVGYFASNLLASASGRWIDALFSRIPFIKILYLTLKDMIDALVGAKKGFNKPVLVMLSPGSGVSVIGFITVESLKNIGLKDMVAVYLPQCFHFAGNLIVVSRERITEIHAHSGVVMALIASGGISTYNHK